MIDIEVEDDAWLTALPDAEALARAAAEVVLASQSFSCPVYGEGGPPAEERVVEGAASSSVPGLAPSTIGSSLRSADGPPPPLAGEENVTILLTDDEAVRELNARFRHKDAPTNVLSFPAPDNPEYFLGDVALAYGVCAAEARAQGKTLGDHLQHLVAHGVLHLLGYDHETDGEAEAMEGLERVVLAGLGIADPYQVAEGDHD